jgi:uncharacterized protein YjbI with pentapeptide repeats
MKFVAQPEQGTVGGLTSLRARFHQGQSSSGLLQESDLKGANFTGGSIEEALIESCD